MKKKTVVHTRILPSVNKYDPAAQPPELTEQDAKAGVLSLLNRGFLPVGVDLTPAFATNQSSIMKNGRLKIHNRLEQPVKSIPYTNPSGFNVATLKFDISSSSASPSKMSLGATQSSDPALPSPSDRDSLSQAAATSSGPKVVTINFPDSDGAAAASPSGASMLGIRSNLANVSMPNQEPDFDHAVFEEDRVVGGSEDDATPMEELSKNVEKIRGYNELLDTYSLHQFIIHKGRTMRETPEFISFKRVAQEIWGSVEEVIKALETLLMRFFVPLAYIDGQRLMGVAAMDLAWFSTADLLSCIVNEDQVSALIRRPGQRYKGKDRKRKAATTLQGFFRMCLHRNRYTKFRHHGASANVIQQAWRIYSSQQNLKRRMKELRALQQHRWDAQMLRLKNRWYEIRANRRMVIHVPSCSIDERSRLRADNFSVKQNLQLSRLCGILDGNVDVIYVSPFELTADVSQYFMKLLELGGVANASARVKLVFPEQATRFPAHFSLASVLLYSPHCLRRIKRFIKGKEAYLVMGMPGPEDKRLAMALQAPILGVDPDGALPLLTKSGNKRFFMKADVNVPTGSYDIYDGEELMFSLAKLILAHLEQNVWLLKIDYDQFGVGVASVDVSTLSVLRGIRREKQSPDFWKQPGVRDTAARQILTELERTLPSLFRAWYPEVYPNYNMFLQDVTQFGVVVEAAPAGILGSVRANLFVEPSGDIHLTSTQDLVTSTSTGAAMHQRRTIGFAFPQTVAPYEAIRGASNAIARRLVDQSSVFGYVSVDYLVFQDAHHSPRLWALALHPFLTDSAASFAAFHLLNRGVLNPATGLYHLAAALPEAQSQRNESFKGGSSLSSSELITRDAQQSQLSALERLGTQRSFIVNEYIFHPNVSTMPYRSFFQTCRLHGVCFDVERAVGTVFLLADSLTAGVFGVLCVGETNAQAIKYLRTALEVIAREVGTQPVVDDFDSHANAGDTGNFAEILRGVRLLAGGKSAKLEKIRRLRR